MIDPTNPDQGQYYRAVAEVDGDGSIQVTNGNAYSGDNGRAVIKGNGMYYMAEIAITAACPKPSLLEVR